MLEANCYGMKAKLSYADRSSKTVRSEKLGGVKKE
jgi:hypothetical protein